MTKPRYVYNWKWGFWAERGGRIGYKWMLERWRYCWLEPDGDRDVLTGFWL